MSGHTDVLASTGLAVLVLMVAAWLISLPRRDAGIVDIFWGIGFVVVSWVAWAVGDGEANRSDLLVTMVSIWGIRLSFHLWRRSRGREEDYRYRSMRRKSGEGFAIRSLLTVFLFQGLLIWIVSLPVQLAMTPSGPRVRALAVVGVVIWGIGLFFEALGDSQLTRFRATDTDNKVMDWGLWRYTRHPNYFGDFCVWWGIWLVAADTPDARIGIVGPLLMSLLLLRFSGIPILERGLRRRHEGYDDYAARTSAFIPRPPKSPRAS